MLQCLLRDSIAFLQFGDLAKFKVLCVAEEKYTQYSGFQNFLELNSALVCVQN